MKATRVAVEKFYADGSGVEFGVAYSVGDNTIRITGQGKEAAQFPPEQIEWLMDALYKIRAELPEKTAQGKEPV